MLFRNWWKRMMIKRASELHKRPLRRRRALVVERLEDRSVPSAPGSFDPTFGVGGQVLYNFTNDNTSNELTDTAVLSDGTIIVVGGAHAFSINEQFALARFNADGSLDTNFGTNGQVTTSFGPFGNVAEAVVQQPDGKIVVGGITLDSSFAPKFALAPYNLDGTLDPNFGSGGLVVTDLGGYDNLYDILIQPDGKIVAAGAARQFEALVRYNPDGSLDPFFGTGGVVETDGFFGGGAAHGIALLSDGRIVAGGSEGNGTDFVDRYNSDGSLDPSFGTGGITVTSVPFHSTDVRDIVLQPDGKVVTTGVLNNPTSVIMLVRYNTDGSLDQSFGNGGIVETNVRNSIDSGNSITIQADGRLLVAGGSAIPGGTDSVVARYNPDGSVDTTFGSNGFVITNYNVGGNDQYKDITLQPDGKIIAAGDDRKKSRW
jgi:uncharacterized delta-60 repeat protein